MTTIKFISSLLLISCMFISALCNVPAPVIKSLHIVSNIKYTYSKTLVTSRILNPANISQEVTFRVVLPEEAFITGFVMTIDDESYEAYIKEKEEAKQDYDAAVSAGQSAGHIFQTNSRFSKDFTVSTNVAAEKKVTFNLTYEEMLLKKNRTYRNEVNINPNQVVSNLSIVVNIEDLLPIKNVEVPKFRMTNEIDHNEPENPNIKKEIISPNKVRVEWNPTEDEQKELNAEGLNGQMVVKYDVDASNNSQQIVIDQDGYFVHILRSDTRSVLFKHVVFVLDLSGSMHGNKVEQVKQSIKKILSDLSEHDYFSIVLFSDIIIPWKADGINLEKFNSYYGYNSEPIIVPVKEDHIIPASKNNIDLAQKFMENIRAFGGTNINGALRCAIDIATLGKKIHQKAASPVEPMIIFLTDGEPNTEEPNPEKIIENVDKRNTAKITIFSLGFGFDADMKFLRKLSIANNGFSRRIYEDSDAALQLNNFYEEVASPVLSDVKFEYLPDEVEDTTAVTRNLFSGSEILVLGKVKPNSSVSGVFSAITPEGRETFPITNDIIFLPPKEHNHTYGHLEKMWAYKTIKSLLDQNTLSKNDTIEKKAKDLALKYKFVTPLTSLVVVKPNVSSVVDDSTEGSGFLQPPIYQVFAGPPGGVGYTGSGTPGSSFGAFPSSGIPISPSSSFYVPPQPGPPPLAPEFEGGTGNRPLIMSMGAEELDSIMPVSALPNQTTMYTKVPYTSISWLNQTVSDDGLFLQPPSEVDENDVIALNETNISSTKCSDGTFCQHFVYCALSLFAEDVDLYHPYKCHIEPRFLGVCCPL